MNTANINQMLKGLPLKLVKFEIQKLTLPFDPTADKLKIVVEKIDIILAPLKMTFDENEEEIITSPKI